MKNKIAGDIIRDVVRIVDADFRAAVKRAAEGVCSEIS